ncbi:MAG: FIST N-terminal domain-containing protein [Planctomycetota bacterium]
MPEAAESSIRFASALSTRRDASAAADEACDRVRSRAPGVDAFDFGLLCITAGHGPQAADIERAIRERLGVRSMLTVAGSGVLGDGLQVRGAPGASLLVGSLPGVDVHAFRVQDLPRPSAETDADWSLEHLAAPLGLDRPDARCTILMTDPYSVPMTRLLPAIADARPGPGVPIIGGVASAGRGPGQNVLALNGAVMHAGGIGVTLSGPIGVDADVSQGCLGFGPTMVVTGCRENVLLELGGRRAFDAVREAVVGLSPDQRTRLSSGLFIGRVINEYKDRFGRDDFLIRGVRGFDEDAGAVLTDDFFRVGQTIRLHYRDTQTAREDLGMVLDRQRLRPKPAGVLVIPCQGREAGPAGMPGYDASAVANAFADRRHGADEAKGGMPIEPVSDDVPAIAGFEAAGEIGPIGDGVHMHTQSAVIASFRALREAHDDESSEQVSTKK